MASPATMEPSKKSRIHGPEFCVWLGLSDECQGYNWEVWTGAEVPLQRHQFELQPKNWQETNWKQSLGLGILTGVLGSDTVTVFKSLAIDKNLVFAGCELLFLSLRGLFAVLQCPIDSRKFAFKITFFCLIYILMLIFYKQQQDKLWVILKVTLYQETIT